MEDMVVVEGRVIEPVAVEARPGYRIWVKYADSVEGEVDLSHKVGKGAFRAWDTTVPFAHADPLPGTKIWIFAATRSTCS